MHSLLLQIGALQIRSYGVMAALGFLAATWLITLNRERAKMSSDQAGMLVFLAMIAGIVGARIFYVIQFFSQYRDNLWRIFKIQEGGLVFYGGFFLALAAILLYCYKQKLMMLSVLDLCVPALTVAHACGRIGCFLNGCCFGSPTSCVFGVVFPAGSLPYQRYGAVPLHPVQLYEALFNVLLTVIFFYTARHWKKRGATAACYVIVYGFVRFADEFFRGDHIRIGGVVTVAQLIGCLMVPAGILWLIWILKHDGTAEHKTR
ncbi:MAG: prolipoprotein diacylglyceryl transferase [Victivallaceae bacterium]|nr:prolipoprotein diacylglyceryl transferase [Victivallaceae bacterium]